MSTTTDKKPKRRIQFGFVRQEDSKGKTIGYFPVILASNGKPMLNESQKNLAQLKKTFRSFRDAILQHPDCGDTNNIIEISHTRAWPKNNGPRKSSKTSK